MFHLLPVVYCSIDIAMFSNSAALNIGTYRLIYMYKPWIRDHRHKILNISCSFFFK